MAERERIYHEVKLSTVLDYYASGFSAPKGKRLVQHGAVSVVAVDTERNKVVFAISVESEP